MTGLDVAAVAFALVAIGAAVGALVAAFLVRGAAVFWRRRARQALLRLRMTQAQLAGVEAILSTKFRDPDEDRAQESVMPG